MANIPLDLQRRFEQRWAARFLRPAALKKQVLERQDQQLTEPGKDKRKTHRIKPVGIRSAQAVRARDEEQSRELIGLALLFDLGPPIEAAYLNRLFDFGFARWLLAEISVRTSCASLASLNSRRRAMLFRKHFSTIYLEADRRNLERQRQTRTSLTVS